MADAPAAPAEPPVPTPTPSAAPAPGSSSSSPAPTPARPRPSDAAPQTPSAAKEASAKRLTTAQLPGSGLRLPPSKRARKRTSGGGTTKRAATNGSSGGAKKELFCVCQEPWSETDPRVMISCEACNGWFHCACIHLEEDPETIDKFYCARCTQANPALASVFKQLGRPDLQCHFGPCTRPRRLFSKYCSQACGLSNGHVKLRLLMRTRQPPASGEDPSVAAGDRADLEALKRHSDDTESVRKRIEMLKQQEELLRRQIQFAKDTKVTSRGQTANVDPDAVLSCVGCGLEISIGMAPRHFHKCFRKVESSLVVTACLPTVLPNCPFQAFCNRYDKTNKVYCKRLAALCVEHGQAAKQITRGRPDDICGCPLDDFSDAEHDRSIAGADGVMVCARARPQCLEHLGWQHIRNGEISTDAVTQYLALQFLERQKQQVLSRQTCRGSILAHACFATAELSRTEAEERKATHRTAPAADAEPAAAAAVPRLGQDGEAALALPADGSERPLVGGAAELPKRHWR